MRFYVSYSTFRAGILTTRVSQGLKKITPSKLPGVILFERSTMMQIETLVQLLDQSDMQDRSLLSLPERKPSSDLFG